MVKVLDSWSSQHNILEIMYITVQYSHEAFLKYLIIRL